MGIHAALLSTGKVMWFARPDADSPDNESIAYLWDPTKPVGDPAALQARRSADQPGHRTAVNLYAPGSRCSPTGSCSSRAAPRLQDEGDDWKGLSRVYTFDPWTETWAEQPRMAHGRWYPTQTLLPDGRTLITSGRDETGAADQLGDRGVHSARRRAAAGAASPSSATTASLPGRPPSRITTRTGS